MINPFKKLYTRKEELTEEQRWYPYSSKEDHDAAVNDTIDVIAPIFGGAGKAGLKALVYVKGAVEGSEIILNMKEAVRKWLSKILGNVVESLDKEAILTAAGAAAAKTFSEKLELKYGITCDIDNFYSETLAEELGEWMADIVNEKISKAMGKETIIFSPLFPPDNIKSDIDSFLVAELNTRLNLQVGSILETPPTQLIREVKTQMIDKFSLKISEVAYREKGKLLAAAKKKYIKDFQEFLRYWTLAENTFMAIMNKMDTKTIFGYKLTSSAYGQRLTRREGNKLRQRKYRETHREQRRWVKG